MNLLCELTFDEILSLVTDFGEPKYRASQLARHIARYDCFDEYTDLPKNFVAKLKENYIDRPLTEKTRVTASDGAIRYLFNTVRGDLIEAVYLPHEYGNSVCVSCQVGCGMGCSFCASGYYGLKRNLSAGEIIAQVLFIARDRNAGVQKIVMMGSGEPLANYDNTLKFIKLITSEHGLNVGMRSISISTCGIAENIIELGCDGFTGTLSLSLHAATDEKRRQIMKVASRYSVKTVVDALKTFF